MRASNDFLIAAQYLIELHKIIGAGGCDSEEAELLRDKIDEPGNRLSATERRLFQDLSIDLYTLADEPGYPRPVAQIMLNKARFWADAGLPEVAQRFEAAAAMSLSRRNCAS